jgi:Protein of unknown function (DUF1573)
MKSVFSCLILSFLLVFSANLSAQQAQQNEPTVVKTAQKPTEAVVSTPQTPHSKSAKKAKKSDKSTKKPSSKGLFDNDFDGEVGIQYIGTEPLSDEELTKVKESKRSDATAKSAPLTTKSKAKVAKPVVDSPTPVVVTPKSTDAKPEAKPAVKPTKSTSKAVEKPVMPEETSKIKESKAEVMEAKADVKSADALVVVPPTKKVEIVKTANVPVVEKTASKSTTKVASKSSVRGARMEFETMTIDLGNIKEDAVLERYFDFTNTGSSTLEILDCRGSCGCVQPRAMATIIAPGEHGQIYVKYTARNKVGPQKPVITLTTNGTPSTIRLFVETWVEQIPGGVKDTSTTPKSENN